MVISVASRGSSDLYSAPLLGLPTSTCYGVASSMAYPPAFGAPNSDVRWVFTLTLARLLRGYYLGSRNRVMVTTPLRLTDGKNFVLFTLLLASRFTPTSPRLLTLCSWATVHGGLKKYRPAVYHLPLLNYTSDKVTTTAQKCYP